MKYTAAIEQQAKKCQLMLAETSVCLETTQSKHKAEIAYMKEVEWCARRCASEFQNSNNKMKLKLKSMKVMHQLWELESEKAKEDLKTKLVSQVHVV